MSSHQTVSLALRVGLAFCFLYAGIDSLLNPDDWVGYLPSFMAQDIRLDLLKVFSLFEIGLGLWLVTGRYLKYATGLSGLALVAVVISNMHVFSVVFRDVGLVMAALALYFLADKK